VAQSRAAFRQVGWSQGVLAFLCRPRSVIVDVSAASRIGSFQQAGPLGFHRFPRGSVLIMADWEIRPASAADVNAIAELRAVVLRGDLERLGRYDERRVRQRLRDGFVAEWTWVIEVGGAFAGCVALRPDGDARCHWLEHFYVGAQHQGRGIGSGVLGELLERCDRGEVDGGGGIGVGVGVVRLNVLQGSPARRLYERYGFVVEAEDAVDVFMVRGTAA